MSTCESTAPNITDLVHNGANTSACTFTYSYNWGDGTPLQTVTIHGQATIGYFTLATHTYAEPAVTTTYHWTGQPVSVTGGCTATGVNFTFTLISIKNPGFTWVSSVSPAYGPQAGGTFRGTSLKHGDAKGMIQIVGAGFTGATIVKFGSIRVTDFRVVGEGTAINVVPPANGSNSGVFVTVTSPLGTSATACADSFLGQPIIQGPCNDSYFYITGVSQKATVSLDFLNNVTVSGSPTSGSDGAPSGKAQECGYSTPPSPGPGPQIQAQFMVPSKGTKLTAQVDLAAAQNALIPSAFVGNMKFKLNHPVSIKITLSGSLSDCITFPTPISFFGVAGIDIELQPAIGGSISYTLTLEPGTYAFEGGSWVAGQFHAPHVSLHCSPAASCFGSATPPQWGINASLVAGPVFRLGPKLGTAGAYIEVGPAIGLAVGVGSPTYAEVCAGVDWDAHVNLSVFGFGLNLGVGGPLVNPLPLAGLGTMPDQQCPL